MLRFMFGHHGFWGVHGASQLGMFRDGPLIQARASTNPGSMAPTEGMCSPDGKFVWHSGMWTRRRVNEPCVSVGGSNPTVTVHNADGSTTITNPDGSITHVPGAVAVWPPITGIVCAAPPSDGVVARPFDWVADGDPFKQFSIVLASTENTPITYYLSCPSPGALSLTPDQVAVIIDSLQNQYGGPVRTSLFGGDKTDLGTLFPGSGLRGQAWKMLYEGQAALWTFKTPDGDTKNVYLMLGWDAGVNTFTFSYGHQPTMFQAVDNFITSISPWDPSGTLCSLLPVATKVPNPYVAAGSIVLQMSGKCNNQCPTGMLFDANAKTCSCPVGTYFNTVTKICTAIPPPKLAATSTIPTWMVVVGVVAGLGIMAAIFGKNAPATA